MRDSAQPGDEELLRRMMTGDAQAFEALYDRRQGGVFRFALRMCGSTALAEDITQDVFIEFMRDAHQFNPEKGTVAGYLFGITRHKVLRRLQRERVLVSMSEDGGADSDDAGYYEHDPLVDLSRQEMIDSVRQAVLALPIHYREVVVLCNLNEMSYEQAAVLIGIPVGTVRSRLNRARGMLADKLRAHRQAVSGDAGSARYEL
ncbi:MAG: RNA polymerase sigma factor [Acidobacteriota bacterium]|nr:MAG: RNA polymerase sigma factor [Acidobacteriota bacterium]